MRIFLIKVSLFVLPILAGGIAVEILLRNIPNNYSEKFRVLAEESDDSLRTLITGSSHALYGIDPAAFHAKAYNGAQVSQSLRFDQLLASRAMAHNPGLRQLIVTISYPSYRTTLRGTKQDWRLKNYAIYYHCDTCGNRWAHHAEVLNGSLSEHAEAIDDYYLTEPPIDHITVNSLGYGTRYMGIPQKNLSETASVAALRHTHALDSAILRETTGYLRQLIGNARDHDVRVLLVTLPATTFYLQQLDTVQVQEMIRISENFAEANGHVRYLNWMDHPAFTDQDFRDGDHLNQAGAIKCGQLLDSTLINWNRGQSPGL